MSLPRLVIGLSLVSSLALAGCTEETGFAGGELPPGAEPVDGDMCLVPSAGCACEGEAPVACHVEHGTDGGDLLCGAGTRYCRGGSWSRCENVESYRIAGASAAIVGPVACSLCDPLCNTSRDRPDDSDLTPANSDNVVYDPTGGGVSLPPSPFESPMLVDTDGDGVVDDADDCPMVAGDPRYFGCAPSGDPGIYYELPFNGPSELEPCVLDVAVNAVDVYFLMDTSGSMGGELANLRNALTSGTFVPGCPGGIIGAIDCTIADTQFGVGQFEDYPRSPYGSSSWGDRPFIHRLDITPSAAAAQSAVNALRLSNGVDWPEGHTSALWAVATGGGLSSYLSARTGCAAGERGYPCFRADAIPVIIMLTDAPFHNGTESSYDYSSSTLGFTPPSWTQTIAALQAQGVRVITIESANWSPSYYRNLSLRDFNSLAIGTRAVDSSGNPFVYNVSSNGTGVDAAVVQAVDDLANETRQDVSAIAIDNPGTAFDERQFVQSITAATFGPAGSCNTVSGNRFVACVPGTPVQFEIVFRNDVVVPHPTDAQVFDFTIRALFDDITVAAEKQVRIVVPPENPCILAATTATPCPRETGRYWRVHDASLGCEIPPELPVWGDFDWTATTPADTSITFVFQAATTRAGLAGAPSASVTVPGTSPTINVAALLNAAGIDPTLPFLQVTANLTGSLDHERQPVLTQMQLDYTCTTTE